MKYMLLPIIILLFNACGQKVVVKEASCYTTHVPDETNYTVEPVELKYYVDKDDNVQGLKGSNLTDFINSALTYKGYLYNATQEIKVYRRKIYRFNAVCGRKED